MGKPHRSRLKPAAPRAAETTVSTSDVATDAPIDDIQANPRGNCIPRRDFLAKGSATIAFLAAFQAGGRANAKIRGFDAFTYGVASGDPLPNRIIIWTRVNPSADATPGSGLGAPVHGVWQVSLDSTFAGIVTSGPFTTSVNSDHTVKIDVGGLQPGTAYYFRFKTRGVHSDIGQFKTAPALGSSPPDVRFGLVSCSNLEAGYFSAYRHLAARTDLDFILHVGDYLYEYGQGEYRADGLTAGERNHDPATEIITLADYRRRHACYKADADLRNLHSKLAFITTWDDHETSNDSWRDGAQNHQPGTEGPWVARKAAGIQAYYEWMPLRPPAATGSLGESRPIYRRFSFGTLMDLFMLDLRQYRDLQPSSPADSTAINSPTRSLLGPQQTAWLQGNLASSQARWKFLGNSVQIAPIIVIPALLPPATAALLENIFGVPATATTPIPINVDSWDGYQASRMQILGLILGASIKNCVFLTGDIHSSYANDIPANPASYNPATSPSIATEFVCTSVTSDNVNEIVGAPERVEFPPLSGNYVSSGSTTGFETLIRAFNAWVRDVNLDLHGYSVVDVNANRSQVDNWVITSDASPAFAADPRIDPNATVYFRAAYQTLNNSQKATPAAGQLGPRL